MDKAQRQSAVLLPMIFLAGLVCLPSARAGPGKDTVVSLGNVSGLPKGEVMLPLLLAPSPPELQIGNLSATISFENKDVSFVRAEKGFLLDGVNAEFHAELQKNPGSASRSVLHLEVATKGEHRKALREGLVLTLVFRIAEQASASTVVQLGFDQLSADDLNTPPKPVDPVSGQSGTIEVIPPEQAPYVACFFFTH